MNWLTTRRLQKLGNRVQPDPVFVHRLEKEIKGLMPSRSIFGWIQWHKGMAWASGGMMAMTLAVSGTGVYAYQSEDVTPDHLLYPVRLAMEQVETSTAVTPVQKVNVQTKHLQKRFREQQALLKKQKLTPIRVADFEKGIQPMVDEVRILPPEQAQKMQNEINKVEKAHLKLITKQLDSAKPEAQAEINRTITTKKDALKKRVDAKQLREDILDEEKSEPQKERGIEREDD